MELALVALPLFLLLLGIVEFGRVFYTQLRLQQAAQQAARQIALHYNDPGLTLPGLDALVDDTLLDALDGVIASLDDLDSPPAITPCDAAQTGPQDAEVTLQDTVPIALPVDPIAVTGRATMPCED
jgi:hypothetical protein